MTRITAAAIIVLIPLSAHAQCFNADGTACIGQALDQYEQQQQQLEQQQQDQLILQDQLYQMQQQLNTIQQDQGN